MTGVQGSSELFRVDEDTLLALLERQKIKRKNMVFATPRSTLPTAGDTRHIHPLTNNSNALTRRAPSIRRQVLPMPCFNRCSRQLCFSPLLSAQRLNLCRPAGRSPSSTSMPTWKPVRKRCPAAGKRPSYQYYRNPGQSGRTGRRRQFPVR